MQNFRRWRQGMGQDLLGGIIRGGGPRPAADEDVRLRRRHARQGLPRMIDEQQTPAAIEDEKRFGAVLEERLPAKLFRQLPGWTANLGFRTGRVGGRTAGELLAHGAG